MLDQPKIAIQRTGVKGAIQGPIVTDFPPVYIISKIAIQRGDDMGPDRGESAISAYMVCCQGRTAIQRKGVKGAGRKPTDIEGGKSYWTWVDGDLGLKL